jgi:hypothetical protein
VVAVPAAVRAQSSENLLVTPVLPPGFASTDSQGVADRARPEWQALGVRLGAFTLRPQIGMAGGATSNAFQLRNNETSSAIVTGTTQFDLLSGWSRHFLSLRGTAQVDKFVGNSRRDTTMWALNAAGRYDIHSTLQVAASADVARDNESRFSGEAVNANFVVSPFLREAATIRTSYRPGRVGVQLSANYQHLHFMPVRFQDGSTGDQSIRDRTVTQVIVEGTYAKVPGVAFFAQGMASWTRFDVVDPLRVLGGDSDGVRVLGGVNLELAGFATGTIGVGWSRRNYADPRLSTNSGLSVEGRVALLPEDRTTVTLGARRQLSDANPTSGPFWDTRLSVGVDREVRRNIIVGLTGNYGRQRYLDVASAPTTNRSALLTGTYLISRRLEVRSSLIYRVSRSRATAGLDESRGSLGLTFKL